MEYLNKITSSFPKTENKKIQTYALYSILGIVLSSSIYLIRKMYFTRKNNRKKLNTKKESTVTILNRLNSLFDETSIRLTSIEEEKILKLKLKVTCLKESLDEKKFNKLTDFTSKMINKSILKEELIKSNIKQDYIFYQIMSNIQGSFKKKDENEDLNKSSKVILS